MEYEIISAINKSSLAEQVNRELKQGGQLVGGVSYCTHDKLFIQAVLVVKEDVQNAN